MRIKTDHEKEGEVVGIPECLKALFSDLVVGGSVHQEHDEEHEMTGDTTSLGVVNVERKLRAHL